MELKVWSNFLSFFLKALEGNLHHKHIETNWRITKHKSYPLEYQSFVGKPFQQNRTNMLSIKKSNI